MKRFAALLLLLTIVHAVDAAVPPPWDTRRILPEFHAEGAAIGDVDGDGKPDIAYGPFWFAGPDFSRKHRFALGERLSPIGYSNNFFAFIRDLTGDGWNDIVVFGFPGRDVRLFVNPGPQASDALWPVYTIADQLCHEATSLIDLIPGGLPEIVGARDKAYGYYAAGPDVTQPWVWHPVSAVGRAEKPFGHGMGVGDLNGDGRLDVIEKALWFEQPAEHAGEWKEHRWVPGREPTDGAQILIDDIDGDGDADLITSLRAHGSGIAWFEQTEPDKFVQHDIIGANSTDSPYGVTFREPHGMALVDIDGDGQRDFVSGKRWFAHNGRDLGSVQEPVVYWFRKVKTPQGIEFVPHLVDNDSGIGVGVPIGDLNGDGRPDIVSANKRGLAVHLQKSNVLANAAERWKVPGGRSQEGYATGLQPQEALKRFEVPPGFSVDLIASEPEITQPIAMCFDSRGRLWVVEGQTYPQRAPEGQGRDRVIIFADADGDGSFDSRKVFIDKLNLVSGIQVGFGGVFIGSAPNLLFIPDRDGDDVPDGEPEVLLDGWGDQDTHETLNSLTWGPDGWLYGCHGVFTHSKVGHPGTPDAERQPINAGLWRYHPVRRTFEVFAEGTSNPWGVDFDAYGDSYVTACVIPHLYHLSQGGRYTRQAGQHFDPYTFADIETIADHRHVVGRISDNAFGGPNRDRPPADNADTSALGGGHAHAGLTIYQAEDFPEPYRGDLFFSNLHGHRLVRDRLERDGSGHIGRHLPDLALSNDRQFIGVCVLQGPDGALYFSDWQDKQTCHHRDVKIWDRSNGRIYRVRYGAPKGQQFDLAAESDYALVQRLAHTNVFFARQAQRLLQERVTFGKTAPQVLKAALAEFEQEHADDVPLRLRAFWTAHAAGVLTAEDLIVRLNDPSDYMRGWALQMMGERKAALSGEQMASVESLIGRETSLVTRRFVASLLGRVPLEQRWPLATALIKQANDQNDRNIPLLTWYAVSPLVGVDPGRALTMSDGTAWAQLREFIARRAALFPAGREALMKSLTHAGGPAAFAQRAGQLLLALEQLPPVSRPAGWDQVKARSQTLAAENPAISEAMRKLGARFGDSEFFVHWREVATDNRVNAAQRMQAIDLLVAGNDSEVGALARTLLDQRALLPSLLKALRTAPSIETAQALVPRLADLPADLRSDAINLLAGRPEMALVLLQAVDARKVPASTISPVLLDQFVRFQKPELTAIIDRHWSRGGAGVDGSKLASAIEAWKAKLSPRGLASADASRGRAVFQRTCGICHQLFGEGVAIGPDLTGSNRANLDYLLENVLAPSALVGRDYLLNIITQRDGTIVSGMIRGETPDFLTVVMPGGTQTQVRKSEIVERKEQPISLMPAGLFDALPLAEVADLVKYLASPIHVTTSSSSSAAATASVVSAVAPAPSVGTAPAPALEAGARRIEAENLRPDNAKVTGGELRRQDMSGFRASTWSGGAQLFWVGVHHGDTLTFSLPGLGAGTYDLTLWPTLARDYGRFHFVVQGDHQEVDLFTPGNVHHADPVRFRAVKVEAGELLRVIIVPAGANSDAKIGKYGFVFGLDCIDVADSRSDGAPASQPAPRSTPAPPRSESQVSPAGPRVVPPAGPAEPVERFVRPAVGPLRIQATADALSISTATAESEEVARFQTRPLTNSGLIVPSVSYFHPLRTPSGVSVTAFAPKPHPYYRGVFMGFVETTGVRAANFWGGGGGPIKGSATVNLSTKDFVDGSPARFRAMSQWQYEGAPLVNEDLAAALHLDGPATVLDLTYTLTAIADHSLAHCNVGGIALPLRYDGRLTAHGPSGPMTLTSSVYREDGTNWPSAAWYGYTVQLPEATVSAAIINHPSNPETRWHCALGARVINPNITTEHEVLLKAGVPLKLRYRVVALDGSFDGARMETLTQEFAKSQE